MNATLSAEPLLGIDAIPAAGMPARPNSPAQAVRDFEALFLETLLRQAGLARAIDGSGDAAGGVAGELFVREIARGLAGQLNLGVARYVSGQEGQ